MSDTKPTPEPVRLVVLNDGETFSDLDGCRLVFVTPEEEAECGATYEYDEVVKDRARASPTISGLLGAAPDFYEACKTLLKLYDEDGLFWPPSDDSGFAWRHEAQDMFDAVRAAIAKAEKGMP